MDVSIRLCYSVCRSMKSEIGYLYPRDFSFPPRLFELEPVLDFRKAKDNPILVHPEENWEALYSQMYKNSSMDGFDFPFSILCM